MFVILRCGQELAIILKKIFKTVLSFSSILFFAVIILMPCAQVLAHKCFVTFKANIKLTLYMCSVLA